MAYSQAFSQAIAMVVYIAVKMDYENNSQYLATRYISDKLNIPVPTANKVLKSLVVSGIITAKEGAKGGLTLAKSPATITLLDIFTAIEQERPLFKSVTGLNFNQHSAVESYKDRINAALVQSENAMKAELRQITIQQLMG